MYLIPLTNYEVQFQNWRLLKRNDKESSDPEWRILFVLLVPVHSRFLKPGTGSPPSGFLLPWRNSKSWGVLYLLHPPTNPLVIKLDDGKSAIFTHLLTSFVGDCPIQAQCFASGYPICLGSANFTTVMSMPAAINFWVEADVAKELLGEKNHWGP